MASRFQDPAQSRDMKTNHVWVLKEKHTAEEAAGEVVPKDMCEQQEEKSQRKKGLKTTSEWNLLIPSCIVVYFMVM